MHTERRQKANWHLLYFQRSLWVFKYIFKLLLFCTARLQEKDFEIFLGEATNRSKIRFPKMETEKKKSFTEMKILKQSFFYLCTLGSISSPKLSSLFLNLGRSKKFLSSLTPLLKHKHN